MLFFQFRQGLPLVLILIHCCLFCANSFGASENKVDSLQHIIKGDFEESVKRKAELALVNHYHTIRNHTVSIRLADSLIEHTSLDVLKKEDREFLFDLLILKGYACFRNAQYKQSISASAKAFELAKKDQDTFNMMQSNLLLAKTYFRTTQRDSVLFYLLKNRPFLNNPNCTKWKGDTYMQLGLHYCFEMDFEKSKDYFSRIIQAGSNSPEALVKSTYANLGILYNSEGKKLDSALFYFHTALEQDSLNYSALNGLGTVYKKQGNYEKALIEYKKFHNLGLRTNNRYVLSGTSNNIAGVLIEMGRNQEALTYALKAEKLALEINNIDRYLAALLRQEWAYEGMKDYQKALTIKERYWITIDSLNTADVKARISELQTTHDLAEKTQDLELSNAKNEAQAAQLAEEKLRTRNAVIVLIALVLIVGVVVFSYFRLQKAKRALANSNAIKDRFFAIIAHDLRGGFSGFSGIGPLIHELVQKGETESVKKICDELENESSRLDQMLDSLLQWAFSQLDRINIQKENVDLGQLLDERRNELLSRIESKKINLEIDLNCKSAQTDKNATSFILRNLIGNAIKFSPAGGLIQVKSRKMKESIAIDVIDQGMGMDEQTVSKLFKPEQKVSHTGTKGEKGNGLGLILSHEFAKRIEGKIQVDSKLNDGSTFTLILPAA